MTPEELLAAYHEWAQECEDTEYTDTGEAWNYLGALADALATAIGSK